MKVLFKESLKYVFAIISAIFTLIPEAIFGKGIWIPESFWKQFQEIADNALEINIIANRVVTFIIVLVFTVIVYKLYLHFRKKVSIEGNNYIVIVEYGDLLKMENCKKVINFDECFSTKVGEDPADIKPTSICGQYLMANPDLDVQSLIYKAGLEACSSKSKYEDKECYESGRIIRNGQDLLMAFVKLDSTGRGRLTRDEYVKCLSVLWEEIDKYYGQSDVCIPILGAGLTRMDGTLMSQQELLDIMICSYKLSPHKIKLPYKLRIICRQREGFSLDKIGTQI